MEFLSLQVFYRFYSKNQKDLSVVNTVEISQDYYENTHHESSMLSATKKYLYVLRKIWVQLVNIALIYMVSLSLFPAILARIESTNHLLSEHYFTPVFCFLFFNVFALIGNLIAQYIQWPGPKYLIIFCVVRLIFVPFFLYCNYIPDNERTQPVLFNHDWMFILATILMACSSGYFSSLAMMYTPRCVRPELATTAGMFAALTIILGILIGINISLIYPLFVS